MEFNEYTQVALIYVNNAPIAFNGKTQKQLSHGAFKIRSELNSRSSRKSFDDEMLEHKLKTFAIMTLDAQVNNPWKNSDNIFLLSLLYEIFNGALTWDVHKFDVKLVWAIIKWNTKEASVLCGSFYELSALGGRFLLKQVEAIFSAHIWMWCTIESVYQIVHFVCCK